MWKLPEMEQLLWWATGISAATLLLTLVAVPWVIANLPEDYFAREPRLTAPVTSLERPQPWQPLLMGLKNLLGAVLVLLGVLMLFTPGQGLLTLLAGLLLMNFPGKYRLERALVSRPGVLRALNWVRDKQARPAFEPPVRGESVD